MMSPYVKILIATSLLLGACTIQKPIIRESVTHHTPPEFEQTKSDTLVYSESLPLHHNYSIPKKILKDLTHYERAFEELKAMLEGTKEANFERAVFISENPYYGNKYSFEEFQRDIEFHLFFVQKLIELNDKSDSMDFNVKVNQYGRFNMDEIRHLPGEKEELYRKAISNWAIFTYITDTTGIYLYHPPFTYATHDPFGIKDWSNSQVIHLLYSQEQKGNCFALTAFYKILADRLNTDVRLCTAPQHIYIQHRDPKGDYYNVELATAGHPGDGTIQTLTHTTTEAIKNGIALRSYGTRQSIGLCLINLAKSYEHKFGAKDDDFLLKCAELVLKHDNRNLNALLLKQQVLDTRVMSYALEKNVSDINLLKTDTEISQYVYELEKHLVLLYRLGYRQMPYDMQEIIMTGIIPENFEDKNPSPFTTITPKEEHRTSYQTLYGGLFQEVFETREFEPYGHFTFQTATNKITVVDTIAKTGFLIDPVAFAYDFGARMYDARVGRWLSRDRLEREYTSSSPYTFVLNTPIQAIDPDGMRVYFVGGAGNDQIGWNYIERFKEAFERNGIKNFKRLNVSHDNPQKLKEGGAPKGDMMFTSSFRNQAWYPVAKYNNTLQMHTNAHSLMRAADVNEQVRQAVIDVVTDLAINPLEDGEQLNLTGYSYGSIVQAHVALALADLGIEVDNLILIGSPISSDSELFDALSKNKNIKNIIRKDIPNDKLSNPSSLLEFVMGMFQNTSDDGPHFDLARPGQEVDNNINEFAKELNNQGVE